jgi:hypothetical protein
MGVHHQVDPVGLFADFNIFAAASEFDAVLFHDLLHDLSRARLLVGYNAMHGFN